MTCKFFVVPESFQALLGMLDIELSDILSIECNITDMPQRCREINTQVEEECYTKIQILIEPPPRTKITL